MKSRTMKRKEHILITILLVVLFGACSKNEQQSAEEHHEEEINVVGFTDDQMRSAGVAVGKIEKKQISGTIRANGVLDVPPQQLVSVSVPLGGFLKSTSLLEGSRVKKGQLIAVIENPEYIQLQQDYLEAKNQLEFAGADYQRQQELAKENVNAQKTLQQAKSSYQTWMAKKNGLTAKLKLINIDIASLDAGNITSISNVYSRIDGYVTEVNVNIGRFVNPVDVLFEIVDTEHLHAELIIFEKDVPRIRIGQKLRFTLANESTERMATVYLIGREIRSDRSIPIHCHIDKEDKELLPGMSLTAIVETGGELLSALPDEAIVDFQGKKYIFIPAEAHKEEETSPGKEDEHNEGQHFQMTEIQIGNSELGFTEVILPEGINEHTQVVVKGSYSMLSKLKNSGEEEHSH